MTTGVKESGVALDWMKQGFYRNISSYLIKIRYNYYSKKLKTFNSSFKLNSSDVLKCYSQDKYCSLQPICEIISFFFNTFNYFLRTITLRKSPMATIFLITSTSFMNLGIQT